MVKGQKKLKLGRKASHTKALVKNLMRSLFTNGYLTTTTIKAKALREVSSKLLNDLKSKDLAVTRKANTILGSAELVKKVVAYLDNNEGKIKLSKIGYRDGDKAETSRVSLVGYNVKKDVKGEAKEEKKEEKKNEVKKETKRSFGKSEDKKVTKQVTARKERVRTRSGI